MGSSSGFAEGIKAIDRMGRLPRNWDGHGALAVPLAAREQAALFLRRVEEKFGYQVQPPKVGAVPGGIVLLWRVQRRGKAALERELEIVFTERGNEWHASDREGLLPTMSGEDVDLDSLLKIIDRFVMA